MADAEIALQTLLRDLSRIGFGRASVCDAEGTEIAAVPSEPCGLGTPPGGNNGMIALSYPLLRGDSMLGSLAFSAVLPAGCDREVLVRRLIHREGADDRRAAELREAVYRLPVVPAEAMEGARTVLRLAAEYIVSRDLLDTPVRSLPHQVKTYIRDHYADHVSLSDLCVRFGCSKSTLMNSFRDTYGVTIGAALTEERLRHAERLLADSDLPVRQIAADCGFADQGYFTKVFSAERGFSPSEYRRRIRAERKAVPHP